MKDIFHEIHITVEHKKSFEEDCKSICVKPIIIEMSSEIPNHSMTSSTLKNNSDKEAMDYATGLKEILESKGYTVTRVKIETVPWHKDASDPYLNQYFESHLAISGDISDSDLKRLSLHKSRNLLKKESGTVQMLTYRRRDINNVTFNSLVNQLVETLESLNVTVIKVIREFAIYDSNESLDSKWLAL